MHLHEVILSVPAEVQRLPRLLVRLGGAVPHGVAPEGAPPVHHGLDHLDAAPAEGLQGGGELAVEGGAPADEDVLERRSL